MGAGLFSRSQETNSGSYQSAVNILKLAFPHAINTDNVCLIDNKMLIAGYKLVNEGQTGWS